MNHDLSQSLCFFFLCLLLMFAFFCLIYSPIYANSWLSLVSSAALALHWAQHLITSFLLHLPFAMSLLLLIRFANATGFPLQLRENHSSFFFLFFRFFCSCVCHLFWLISCASLSFFSLCSFLILAFATPFTFFLFFIRVKENFLLFFYLLPSVEFCWRSFSTFLAQLPPLSPFPPLLFPLFLLLFFYSSNSKWIFSFCTWYCCLRRQSGRHLLLPLPLLPHVFLVAIFRPNFSTVAHAVSLSFLLALSGFAFRR